MDAAKFYGATSSKPNLRYLQSAKDVVEASSSRELEIVLLPPDCGDQPIESDEEGDDNVLDEEYVPQETAGEVEIHGGEFDEDEIDENISKSGKWKKTENLSLRDVDPLTKSDEIVHAAESSMFEIFLLFFSDDMIDLIVEQTNLYATRDKNIHNFKTDRDELKKFLGLILMSGYHSLPSENDYWSTAEDLIAPIFSSTMSRDRFRLIKRYLHIADNSNLSQSKVAKILPLYERLKENCLRFGFFHQFLSIDESMVPYRGLHSARQYIKGKPVKFGYKIWMLCSSDGYPYNFEIYCGKEAKRVTPLGSHVVQTLLSPVSNKKQHIVFFDNFFTSYELMKSLANQNIRACGTVRENRTGRCPLPSNKEWKKKSRGSYDFRSDGTVLCVKWQDNCVVSAASNYYGVSPIQTTERRVKMEKNKSVDQPFLLKMYNKGMGGVDVCDRLLSSYRPRLRSKKWWWNLFSHALNLSIVAAFKFYNEVNKSKVTHLEFRREVARALVKSESVRLRAGGPTAPPCEEVRYDGMNHFLEATKQGRCVLCKKNTRLSCVKCGKRLHKSCSETFHKKVK